MSLGVQCGNHGDTRWPTDLSVTRSFDRFVVLNEKPSLATSGNFNGYMDHRFYLTGDHCLQTGRAH